MKRIFATIVLTVCFATPAFADDKPMKAGHCTFANMDRLKAHTGEHLKFPAKGKDIKQVCKKEYPDEFSKAEWACFDASIKDDKEYTGQAEIYSALGVKQP